MVVQGASEELISFLKNLDAVKLVDLAADILSTEGHSEIKITDGPGDGQRDIHSKTKTGEKQLTQSKFHSDLDHSISAKELGEVALGMIRLGYKKGLLITNSKISPPAKRDCLNLYPGYSIDFIDGIELIKKVFGNIVIRSIWFDGKSIDRVNYQIVVPISVRDLDIDKSVAIFESLGKANLKVGNTTVVITFRKEWIDTKVFGQYRPPILNTLAEIKPFKIYGIETIISGVIHLDEIPFILRSVAELVLSRCQKYFPHTTNLAIILGIPCLCALGEENSASEFIELVRYSPETFVYHNNIFENQKEWLIPNENDEWILPDDIRPSHASWVYWYNPIKDTCLNFQIVKSPPDEDGKWQLETQYNFFSRWWMKSLFFIIPETLKNNWDTYHLQNPSEWFQWYENSFLAAYYHPRLESPFMEIPFEPECENKSPKGMLYDNQEDLIFGFRGLTETITKFGGELINPEKARFLIAFLSKDPFPITDSIDYRNFDLTFNTPGIPTPIDPKSRRIQFIICWLIEDPYSASQWLDSNFDSLNKRIGSEFFSRYWITINVYSDDYFRGKYLIAYIDFLDISRQERSIDIVRSIQNEIDSIQNIIERELDEHIVKRATLNFFMEVIGVVYRSKNGSIIQP
jgi:hypothetical protein